MKGSGPPARAGAADDCVPTRSWLLLLLVLLVLMLLLLVLILLLLLMLM